MTGNFEFLESYPVKLIRFYTAALFSQELIPRVNNCFKFYILASTGTNFLRKDTQKSKAGKQIDLQRRQKKIKEEKDRLKNLRQIGNVKIPKDTITNVYKMI